MLPSIREYLNGGERKKEKVVKLLRFNGNRKTTVERKTGS